MLVVAIKQKHATQGKLKLQEYIEPMDERSITTTKLVAILEEVTLKLSKLKVRFQEANPH